MKTTLMKLGSLIAVAAPVLLASCTSKPAEEPAQLTVSGLDPKNFADTINGKATGLYTLTNANGMEVCITNMGGRVVSLMVPDRDGNLVDVVAGFDNVKSYANLDGKTPSDYGAAIGRYANRIDQGKFTLDGTEYQLPQNNFGHCLHGGPTGWQYQVYEVVEQDSLHLTLKMESPDGDNNFPGAVTALVTYKLDEEDNTMYVTYEATTDKPTIINMTNHSYFNLSGDFTKDCLEDTLFINSTAITPIDATCMTHGVIEAIEPGSTFDFSKPKAMGQNINDDNEQLKNANGYDHNYVLNPACADLSVPACVLFSGKTGIAMCLMTNEPGVQVYTGNFQDGTSIGKKGIAYPFRCAVCLEPQKYPNTPNTPEWPSAVLRPGETYSSVGIYEFHTDNEKPCCGEKKCEECKGE